MKLAFLQYFIYCFLKIVGIFGAMKKYLFILLVLNIWGCSSKKATDIKYSFDKKKYTIKELECRRAIHSKNPGAKAVEVIITN